MGLTWRDRYGEEATCVRCLEVRDTSQLDRLLWCEACRERARARAGRWGWMVGVVAAALLTLWIAVAVRPSRELVLGGWIATVVASLWLAARIAREIGYGVMRFRNRRAVEAVPPALPGEEPPSRTGPPGGDAGGEGDRPSRPGPPGGDADGEGDRPSRPPNSGA